jgi:hypothetical protein
VLPPPVCTPGERTCSIFLPIKPVCGCDGKTYRHRCEALVENCVSCWKKGPCGFFDTDTVEAAEHL